jgi:hypothetical protein
MLALEMLAEKKIAEALERGELDDLPGAGKPLDLDDDALVPEDLRLAYRVLKNAGYVPQDIGERARAARKLELLQMKLEPRYYARVVRKLSR